MVWTDLKSLRLELETEAHGSVLKIPSEFISRCVSSDFR